MSDRSDAFADEVMRRRIGGICHVLGWQSIHLTSLDTLVDLIRRYIQELGRRGKETAEICGRSEINVSDLKFAMDDLGITLEELENYMQNFPTTAAGLDTSPVVKFPAPSEIKLNFLKPGSREVLHRKMHIPDYLPPMYPELELEDSPPHDSNESPLKDQHLGNEDNVKRESIESGEDGTNQYSTTDHHHPVREIASVMMTSAGFISPAREGRLPDSRTPHVVTASDEGPSLQKQRKEVQESPSAMKPPATPKSAAKKSNNKGKADLKASPAGKSKQKLSVFQKKAPKQAPPAVSVSPQPPQELESPKVESKLDQATVRDHTDDIIDSVIERGVIESESIEAANKQSRKRKRNESKQSKKVVPEPEKPEPVKVEEAKELEEEPELHLPPPPSPPKTPTLHSDFSDFSSNPLIPRQIYGFPLSHEPEEPVVEKLKNPLLAEPEEKFPEEKREKERDKSMKKKRNKKDKEKAKERSHGSSEHKKKDKKEKKKKLEKDREKEKEKDKDKEREKETKATNEGFKIRFKDSSVAPSTKVVFKGVEPTKTHKKSAPTHTAPVEPALFQEPIKLDRLSGISEAPPKPKRGRPEKKNKEHKKPPVGLQENLTNPLLKSLPSTSSKNDALLHQPGSLGHFIDAEGNEIWICPACNRQDDGSPMIGCDECDDWYHWLCVGIQQEPEDTQNWFCKRCVEKKEQKNKPAKRGRPPK